MKRVVITGLGAITPIGIGRDEYWNALISGKSGIGKITRFDTSEFTSKIGAEVKDFEASDYMDTKESRRMDRFSQFAVAATKLAFEDSKIDLENTDLERVGVVVGSGIGGMETLEKEFTKMTDRGPNRVSPLFIPMMISNMAPGQVSMAFGLKGTSMAITTACASGTHAIGEGFRMIKEGKMDIIVAGGTEAAITPIAVAGFCSMKALSTRNDDPEHASRPFDKGRDGFVMGEGAGILILEDLEHALARGADIYGEVVGYG